MEDSKSVKIVGLILAISIGAAVGIGGYTFVYAKGASYLSNDPSACANCHVMRPQLNGWIKSSHHKVAVCNDCHTPPDVVGKYLTKAQNGFWHSFAFTSGNYPDAFSITERNKKVTEQACRKCHEGVVSAIDARHGEGQELSCLKCHTSVGHNNFE